MSQETAFAVPKDRQNVTVVLCEGKALHGSIFLEYQPGEPSVHHRMMAFLGNSNSFFPLLLKQGDTAFINKANINMIELAFVTDQEDLSTALSLMQSFSVTAVFNDASKIYGVMLAELPVEKTRLSDCLNLPARFLIIKTDSAICYINKDSLRKVISAAKQ